MFDFDHIERDEKKFSMSEAIRNHNVANVRLELQKCQILCKPYHKKKTGNENAAKMEKYTSDIANAIAGVVPPPDPTLTDNFKSASKYPSRN